MTRHEATLISYPEPPTYRSQQALPYSLPYLQPIEEPLVAVQCVAALATLDDEDGETLGEIKDQRLENRDQISKLKVSDK